MAFNIRKSKRMPATPQETETNELPEYGIVDPTSEKSNVVATQSWVFKVLNNFWKWTKFFATESMQVAGGIHAGRVKTCELQTNDIYATKIYLLDREGKPCVIYVNDLGELKTDYDFKNVFVYPGDDSNLEFKKYVYRYGQSDERIAGNFVGLTPYEILLNFVPFESNSYKKFNDKECYRICPADGEDVRVDGTMLVTCAQTKKITGVEVLDQDGQVIKSLLEIPEDRTYRRLTINMPCFKDIESGEKQHIVLPSDFPSIGGGAYKPFVPPFLLPPKPPYFIPPAKPSVPAMMFQESLNNDIFDEQEIDDSDDLFADIDKTLDDDMDKPVEVKGGYEVVYADYATDTYVNIVLKDNDFEKNKEQYIRVVLADTDN